MYASKKLVKFIEQSKPKSFVILYGSIFHPMLVRVPNYNIGIFSQDHFMISHNSNKILLTINSYNRDILRLDYINLPVREEQVQIN